MESWRKLLCLFLAMVMCLSLMPLSAFAAEEEEEQNLEEELTDILNEDPAEEGQEYGTGDEPGDVTDEPTASGEGDPTGEPSNELGNSPADEPTDNPGDHPPDDPENELNEQEENPDNEPDEELGSEEEEDEAEIASIVASGTWGDNVSWTLDDQGTLTISGSGEMKGYPAWKYNESSVKTVVIESGIPSITDMAFYNCENLTSVTLPDSITSIGELAFHGCERLVSINIPNGVTTIKESTFQSCSRLSNINLPDTVTGIEEQAFYDCKMLTSINIPDGVTSIGRSAFSDCEKLTGLVIPDSVMSIGAGAFSGCKSLVDEHGFVIIHNTLFCFYGSGEVVIPYGVESISDNAFYNYGDNVTSISIPNSVTSIGEAAFYGCINLTNITIPDSVTSIGEHAFYDCTGLADENGFVIVSNILFDFCGSGDVIIPNGVTNISEDAFGWSSDLTSVTIPNSVKRIGPGAFHSCVGLTSITIPSSVTELGTSVFNGCSNLKVIIFQGDALDFNAGTFNGVTASIYYPADNDTWTEVVLNTYQGITWIAQGGADPNEEDPLPDYYEEEPSAIEIHFENEAEETEEFADGITVDIDRNNPEYGQSFNLLAAVYGPAKDYPVNWTVTDTKKVYANYSFDTENLNGTVLTVTPKNVKDTGKVTVTASTTDGSNLKATIILNFVSRATGITILQPSSTTIVSGQTLQMRASIDDESVTDGTIIWSLSLADQTYASISSNGLITAKRVMTRREITVYASSSDQSVIASIRLQIIPVTDWMTPFCDGIIVLFGKQTCDLSANDPALKFSVVPFPIEAEPEVKWALTDKNNLAVLEDHLDGTATLRPSGNGKTGTVILTATAQDGSKKAAKVTVNFVKYANSVTILNAPEGLTAGNSVTLKADVTSDKTLTDKSVIWHIRDRDKAFANIDSKGKLTAKTLGARTVIEVTAEAKANGVMSEPKQIILYPKTIAIEITQNKQNKSVIGVSPRRTIKLDATVWPLDASDMLKWTSDNTKIATVAEDGTVTAGIKTGKAKITCTATDGSKKSASVTIMVSNLVEAITISSDKNFSSAADVHEVRAGGNLQFYSKAVPENATLKTVKWEIEGNGRQYASISSSGKLKAAKAIYNNYSISVIARATDGSGVYASYPVTLKPRDNEQIAIWNGSENITGKTIALNRGAEKTLAVKNALGEPISGVKWSTSNGKISINSNGKLSAIQSGTSKLTAKIGSYSASVTVNICVFVDDIKVTAGKSEELITYTGKSITLTATPTNPDAGKKTFTWKLANDEDKEFATITSKGKFTAAAKADGVRRTVEVIATVTDGSNKEYRVPVDIIPITTCVIIKDANGNELPESVDYDIGRASPLSFQLSAEVFPGTASDQVSWKSSNKKIATIENGTVKMIGTGTVKFTASATDGSKVSDTVTYVISKTVLPIALKITTPEEKRTLDMGGEKRKIEYKFEQPIQPTNKKVKWSIPNEEDKLFISIDKNGEVKTTNFVDDFGTRVVAVQITAEADPAVKATVALTIRSIASAERAFLAEYDTYRTEVDRIDNSRLVNDEQAYKVQKSGGKYYNKGGICTLNAAVILLNRYRAYYNEDYTNPYTIEKLFQAKGWSYTPYTGMLIKGGSTQAGKRRGYLGLLGVGVNNLFMGGEGFKVQDPDGSEFGIKSTKIGFAKGYTEKDLAKILMDHPEGIYVWAKNNGEHAVVLTDFIYENGKFTFYVIDPVYAGINEEGDHILMRNVKKPVACNQARIPYSKCWLGMGGKAVNVKITGLSYYLFLH